jgi:3-hydroxybenzoate 6-monooxygenase
MSDWKDREVLIVGGGIGGLAAALALVRQGIAARIIEQAAEFKEIGAGIQLGPNVFWMFELLGLIEPVSALAVFPNNLIMMDSITGEEVTRVSLGDAFRKKFHHPYALIHRADLHRVLLEACRASPCIALDAGRKVVDVAETGDGVTVRTESGTQDRGAALIGADGIWSMIRERVVGDGAPRPAGHITYRAVLPTAEMPEKFRWRDMVVWAGEKVHLVHYPLRTGELFNLVAVFHSNKYEEGWDSYGDPAELYDRFAETCAPVRTLLEKIESWRMWVVCDRPPIKDWSRGRITLLGDAAHPMLQYLAQGAAMAIEDAVCLADKVVEHDGDYPAAFRAYPQARYLRTGRVQIMARVYGEFFHAGGVARELRNLMLGARTPQDHLAGVEWLYGEQKELTRNGAYRVPIMGLPSGAS